MYAVCIGVEISISVRGLCLGGSQYKCKQTVSRWSSAVMYAVSVEADISSSVRDLCWGGEGTTAFPFPKPSCTDLLE